MKFAIELYRAIRNGEPCVKRNDPRYVAKTRIVKLFDAVKGNLRWFIAELIGCVLWFAVMFIFPAIAHVG